MIDVVALGRSLRPPAVPGLQWGIVQSNNDDGTANVRLGASQTTVVLPYATPGPVAPGRKVGVTFFGPDGAITHAIAPAAPPSIRLWRKSGNQSIDNATNTPAIFSALRDGVDAWGMWNGTDTVTIPVSGVYSISFNWAFTQNATGYRQAHIGVNGSAQILHRVSPVTTTNVLESLAGTVFLTAGDSLTAVVYQNSGGNLDLLGSANYDCALAVAWVSWRGQADLYGPELVINGGAESLTTDGFSTVWNSNLVLTVTTTGGEYASGSAGFKGAGTGTSRWVHQGPTMSVQPGEVYKFSGKFRSSVTTSGTTSSGGRIEILYSGVTDEPNYFDLAGTPGLNVVAPTVTNTTFKTLQGEWTVPDGIYWIRPAWRFDHTATCNFFLDDLSIVKKDLS